MASTNDNTSAMIAASRQQAEAQYELRDWMRRFGQGEAEHRENIAVYRQQTGSRLAAIIDETKRLRNAAKAAATAMAEAGFELQAIAAAPGEAFERWYPAFYTTVSALVSEHNARLAAKSLPYDPE